MKIPKSVVGTSFARTVVLKCSSALLVTCLINAGAASPAQATTQCQVYVRSIWAGDNGQIWLGLSSGGNAVISAADLNREAVIGLATTALVSARQIVVRYQAENVNCADTRTDFLGMHLI